MKQLKKILTGNLGVSALLLAAVGLLLSYIAGWCVSYGANIDYILSSLLRSGETRLPYLSFFLSAPLAGVQRLFGTFNVFAASQLVGCLAALLTLNYVLIAKLGKRAGVVIACLSDVLLYSACVLTLQFHHTAALLGAAGALLFIYAHFSARHGKTAWLQRILGGVMLLFGSLYSGSAFLCVAVFGTLTVLCLLAGEVMRNGKFSAALKRHVRFLVSFVLVFALCFGAGAVSEAVKTSDASYTAASRVMEGKKLLTQGTPVPFEEDADFYRAHHIFSQEELSLLDSGVMDAAVLSGGDVKAIGKAALYHRTGGSPKPVFAVKSVFRRTIRQLKNTVKRVYLALKGFTGSKALAFTVAAFGAAVLVALFVLWLRLRKKYGLAPLLYGGVPLKTAKLALAALWVLFFVVYPFNFTVSMLAPCAVLSVLTLRSANARHTAVCWLFSLPVMALYAYQSCFSVTFRTVFSFAVPAFLCLAYLYDFNNMENLLNAKPSVKSVAVTLALILAITMTANLELTVWKKGFGVKVGKYPQTAASYMKKHPDETFALTTSACLSVDPNYSNALWLSALPVNTVVYGSWADCYAEDNSEVFSSLAQSGNWRLAIKREKQDVIPCFEVLLNNHYAREGEVLHLEPEQSLTATGKYWGGVKQKTTVDIYRVTQE